MEDGELFFPWEEILLLPLDFQRGVQHPKQLKPKCFKGFPRLEVYDFSLNYDI